MLPTYYTICTLCDHFIEPNDKEDIDKYEVSPYVHLDDGEKEHTHDAAPSVFSGTLPIWQIARPDLFYMHRDGKIGPNSAYHFMKFNELVRNR